MDFQLTGPSVRSKKEIYYRLFVNLKSFFVFLMTISNNSSYGPVLQYNIIILCETMGHINKNVANDDILS